MKKEIKIAMIELAPIHQLAISAASVFYDISENELLQPVSSTREHGRRKGILCLLLKTECDMTVVEIADLMKCSRQAIDYILWKAESEIQCYRNSTYDYKVIRTNLLHAIAMRENLLNTKLKDL